MRGLVVGTLALVALEALTRASAAGNVSAGLSWLSSGVARLMSPAVAGIPNRSSDRINVKVEGQ